MLPSVFLWVDFIFGYRCCLLFLRVDFIFGYRCCLLFLRVDFIFCYRSCLLFLRVDFIFCYRCCLLFLRVDFIFSNRNPLFSTFSSSFLFFSSIYSFCLCRALLAVSDSPNEATRRLLLTLLIGDFDFRNSKKEISQTRT